MCLRGGWAVRKGGEPGALRDLTFVPDSLMDPVEIIAVKKQSHYQLGSGLRGLGLNCAALSPNALDLNYNPPKSLSPKMPAFSTMCHEIPLCVCLLLLSSMKLYRPHLGTGHAYVAHRFVPGAVPDTHRIIQFAKCIDGLLSK